jgi:hypothetical protein
MIGPVVKVKPQKLGDRLMEQAQTVQPAAHPLVPRPQFHRNGQPPTMNYHHNHPMLTSPAEQPAVPLGHSTVGMNQRGMNQYLKVLRGA